MNLIPGFIHRRIGHRPNLVKIVDNIGWLFFDKIIRMGGGLFVGVWLARYLGPEQFGLLSYATAFMALFGAFASLGLNGIVLRDLIQQPESASSTLGSAFALQTISGLVAVGLMLFAVTLLRPEDELAKTMVAVLSFSLIFQSREVIKCWYESMVLSRYVVLAENAAFFLLLVVRIVFIIFKTPLIYFAWLIFFDSVLVSLFLIFVYIKTGGELSSWKINYNKMVVLLKEGWPLIISGISAMIYMKIDQIMLSEMLGDKSVGIYVAATRLVEVFYFFPYIIAASFFPIVYKKMLIDYDEFMDGMKVIFSIVYVVALLLSLFGFLFSYSIINFVYGNDYQGSDIIFSVHVFSLVFVFLSAVGGKWFLAEGKQKYLLYRTVIGVVINVVANVFLIPVYGALGASVSTVITVVFVGFLSNLMSKETMTLFRAQLDVISFMFFFKKMSRDKA